MLVDWKINDGNKCVSQTIKYLLSRMHLLHKWNQILTWQKNNMTEPLANLAEPATEEQITQIETLLEEQVPFEFKELYLSSNGQKNNGDGVLFGHSFMASDKIISQLEFSRTFIKPATPVIENPVKSNELIERIVGFYLKHTPKRNLFGVKKDWFKIQFSCSPNSYTEPFLYSSPDTTEDEREIVTIKNYEPVYPIVEQLHELEKLSYNWDELHFILFPDGRYKVTRAFYNFDQEIPFTSTPEKAIKKKYFHYKWLPIFSDHAGNYIGLDLDPDIKGVKGQVINFGRDEEDMFVIAGSLELFFDLLLNEIEINNGKIFKDLRHLHDSLKEILLKTK